VLIPTQLNFFVGKDEEKTQTLVAASSPIIEEFFILN